MSHSARKITTSGRNIEFVEHITKHEVDFLIVGGVAVQFYGCRDFREVDDLDLLLNPEIGNAHAFVHCLSTLVVNVKFTAHQLTQPKVLLPIKVNDFYLDIITPKTGIQFPELSERSEGAHIGKADVRVIARDDLIKMKQDAIEHLEEDVDKHRTDLGCLLAV